MKYLIVTQNAQKYDWELFLLLGDVQGVRELLEMDDTDVNATG